MVSRDRRLVGDDLQSQRFQSQHSFYRWIPGASQKSHEISMHFLATFLHSVMRTSRNVMPINSNIRMMIKHDKLL